MFKFLLLRFLIVLFIYNPGDNFYKGSVSGGVRFQHAHVNTDLEMCILNMHDMLCFRPDVHLFCNKIKISMCKTLLFNDSYFIY